MIKAGCVASPSLQPARPSVSPALRLRCGRLPDPLLAGGICCRAGGAAGVRVWSAGVQLPRWCLHPQGLRAFGSGRSRFRLRVRVRRCSLQAFCQACSCAPPPLPLAVQLAAQPLRPQPLRVLRPSLAAFTPAAQPLHPHPSSPAAKAALTPKAGSPPRFASASGFRSGRAGFRSGLALHPAFFNYCV